jgi:protocatechuate 3,4-dioxygenase beta subunit
MRRTLHYTTAASLALALLCFVMATGSWAAACAPTEPDMMGPFYKAGAPLRSSVGTGYVLEGTVRSAADCAPIAGAVIEFWLAGPDGYDDAHRATIIADASGTYRFESNLPHPIEGRPAHIHVRVTATGYETLVTQHYPAAGKTAAKFDLVLKKDR